MLDYTSICLLARIFQALLRLLCRRVANHPRREQSARKNAYSQLTLSGEGVR